MKIKVGQEYTHANQPKRTYTVIDVRAKGRGHTVVAQANTRPRTQIVESMTNFRKRVTG